MEIFITKNKKSMKIEITGTEAEEYQARIRKALKIQDAKVNKYWGDLKARGVCPQCRLTLPLSKYCSRCQKTW